MIPVTRVEITPETAGSWVDVDISSYVDAGNISLVVLEVRSPGTGEYYWGVRKNGSSDTHYGEITDKGHTWVVIGVDPNDILEINVEDTTAVDVFLMAYAKTSEAGSFTNAVDKSLTTTGSWVDIDISNDTGGDTAKVAFFLVYSSNIASKNYGFRKNGSSDTFARYIPSDTLVGAMIGCDDSEILEGYIESTDVNFYLTGYLVDNVSTWVNQKDYATSTIDAYVDVDFSSDIPADNTGAFVYFHHSSEFSWCRGNVRKNGDSWDSCYLISFHQFFWTEIDSSRVAEQKITSESVDLYLWGYTSEPAAGGDIIVSGTTNTVFSTISSLTRGQIETATGTSATSFSTTGVLTKGGEIVVSGTSASSFSTTGILFRGKIEVISGTSNTQFVTTSTLTVGAEGEVVISGTASTSFSTTASLSRGIIELMSGTADVVFSTTGVLTVPEIAGYWLKIYRDESLQASVRVDEGTRLIRQLLGEDIIKASFRVPDIIDIAIGDHIVYEGVNYYINALPNVRKNATNSYEYDITFESEYYELAKMQFLDSDGNSDFDLVGNLEIFIDLIVTNMNREHSGWAKGTCDQTNQDYKLLNFSKENCMQVLQRLCEEFEGEYYFSGKNIYFTDKVGSDTGLTFKYKQGLRNIIRQTLSEKNIITRLYAFGSTKNLTSDYRDHSRRLKFVVDGKSYLEKNINKYGVIEHTEIFEDIYPHREGTISWVDAGNILKFRDDGMDFDLNDYLLPGVTAKVHFNSGDLGGYEFEMLFYNNTYKEFTIIAYKDEQGYEMPNATLKPAIGDKYVLLDIKMPQSYIDTAETALQNKAQGYLDDNCEPRVTYLLQPDWRYFQTHFISLGVGDFITIEDTDLGINAATRIVELTKLLTNEYKYTLKLSDHLEVKLIQRIYSEQEDLKKKIEIGEGGDIIRARRSWRTSEELRTMIFDTDGYFDMGNIRPASIETGMLSVGTKSTQFILKEVQIEGNYQADVSKFHASGGSLIHLAIADEIRTWMLSENTQTGLVDGTAYYIYAKCTKEPDYTGQIIVDETQRKVDEDATYYYFLIGVLHSVVEGVRGISLTYGQSFINGKFITTGKIQSADGLTYFDLDEGVLAGKAGLTAGLIKSADEKMQLDLDDNVLTVQDINDYVRAKFGKLNGDYGMKIRDSLNEVMLSTGEQLGLSQKYADRLLEYLVGSGYSIPFSAMVSSKEGGDVVNTHTDTGNKIYAGIPRSAQKIDLWGDPIETVKFYLKKVGSPTGTIYARIRRVSDDSIIETSSTTYEAGNLTTSWQWKNFAFSVAPDDYVRVCVEFSGGNSNNYIKAGASVDNYIPGVWNDYSGGQWREYVGFRDQTIQILFDSYNDPNTIDDSLATYWQPDPPDEAGAWVKWDLGNKKMLDGCKIYWGANSDYRPDDYKIYTSPDDTNWTEQVHQSSDPGSGWKEHTFSSRVTAQYLKFVVQTGGHGAIGTRLYEFQVNAANKIWQIGILTGEIAHGGTIPLPSGFAEDECHWLVSTKECGPKDADNQPQHLYCYTTGRTVRMYWTTYFGTDYGTANYIIIGAK